MDSFRRVPNAQPTQKRAADRRMRAGDTHHLPIITSRIRQIKFQWVRVGSIELNDSIRIMHKHIKHIPFICANDDTEYDVMFECHRCMNCSSSSTLHRLRVCVYPIKIELTASLKCDLCSQSIVSGRHQASSSSSCWQNPKWMAFGQLVLHYFRIEWTEMVNITCRISPSFIHYLNSNVFISNKSNAPSIHIQSNNNNDCVNCVNSFRRRQ